MNDEAKKKRAEQLQRLLNDATRVYRTLTEAEG